MPEMPHCLQSLCTVAGHDSFKVDSHEIGRWCPWSPNHVGPGPSSMGCLYSPIRVVSTTILRRHGKSNSLRNTSTSPIDYNIFRTVASKDASGTSTSSAQLFRGCCGFWFSSLTHLSSWGLWGSLGKSNLTIYFKTQYAGRWTTWYHLERCQNCVTPRTKWPPPPRLRTRPTPQLYRGQPHSLTASQPHSHCHGSYLVCTDVCRPEAGLPITSPL